MYYHAYNKIFFEKNEEDNISNINPFGINNIKNF